MRSDLRTGSVIVRPATTAEREDAFRVLFGSTPQADREARVASALQLVDTGDLDPNGILVAIAEGRLAGAMVSQAVPGASGIVWPPQVQGRENRAAIADALVRHAVNWLHGQGVKLGQALLRQEEETRAPSLTRNGFQRITNLWYLRHDLDLPLEFVQQEEALQFRSYDNGDDAEFRRTLERTYEQTLDCPEVNGVRSIDEVLAGHRAQGRHDPSHWLLAFQEGTPVGVLLLADMPDLDTWELAYLGVLPERRGRGHGRQLLDKALCMAWDASATQLTLSVDARNRPAWKLYTSRGFEPFDQRAVYLAAWPSEDQRPGEPGA